MESSVICYPDFSNCPHPQNLDHRIDIAADDNGHVKVFTENDSPEGLFTLDNHWQIQWGIAGVGPPPNSFILTYTFSET